MARLGELAPKDRFGRIWPIVEAAITAVVGKSSTLATPAPFSP